MGRNLFDLHPWLRKKAGKVILLAKDQLKVDVLVYCTTRTFAEQDELYSKGRGKPGDIVTWARAGESYHNYGMAFDFVPYKPGTMMPDWKNDKVLQAVGEIGEDLGLQWGGRWPGKKRDPPHLQSSFGLSVHELQVLYEIDGLGKVWWKIDKLLDRRKREGDQ